MRKLGLLPNNLIPFRKEKAALFISSSLHAHFNFSFTCVISKNLLAVGVWMMTGLAVSRASVTIIIQLHLRKCTEVIVSIELQTRLIQQ